LDQDAINGSIIVELLDFLEEFCFGYGFGVGFEFAVNVGLGWLLAILYELESKISTSSAAFNFMRT
jgi:hypothetical protein